MPVQASQPAKFVIILSVYLTSVCLLSVCISLSVCLCLPLPTFYPSTLIPFCLPHFGLKIPGLDPEPDSAKSPDPNSDATPFVLQLFHYLEITYLLGNTWVDEAYPPRRRVAATSSRQCGWPCPSRSCLLAPVWPRTCYILSLFIFALKCSLLFANFKSVFSRVGIDFGRLDPRWECV